MFEFDTYKKNVHFAEAEIVKFLGETRLDSNNRSDDENDETSMESDSTQTANNGISSKQGINTDYMKAQENEMNRASEGHDSEHGEHADDMLSIKDEMDIEEWEMPKEKTNGVNVVGVPIKEELDIVESEIPREIVMQWKTSELDSSKSSKAIPKAVNVETTEGNKAVVQPAVATPPSTRSTTMNKVSGVGSVVEAGPKKSKRLRSPGKSSLRKSNPPSPGRTRTVEVEMPSCDNSKQGPSVTTRQPVQTEDEIDIEEWQMPKEWKTESIDTEEYGIVSELNTNRNIGNVDPGSTSSKVSTRSSELKNFPSLDASEETARNSFDGKSSSVCTSKDNSIEIRDTNKTINGKDLSVDVVPEEETAELSRSILNDAKSELSYLKAPVSKRKSGFICDVCKKCLSSKRDLGNHVRVHNGERPFSCNICDKTFKWGNGRYRHELRHMRDKMSLGKSEEGNKKKQFSCTVCGKNFNTKNVLSIHSNLHTDKYKCNSCGRCFESNFHLRSHSRTHTKEKPFKCGVCFKCFSSKGNLKTHLLIHSTERPFSCEICGKRFKSKREKTEHELHHLRKK